MNDFLPKSFFREERVPDESLPLENEKTLFLYKRSVIYGRKISGLGVYTKTFKSAYKARGFFEQIKNSEDPTGMSIMYFAGRK